MTDPARAIKRLTQAEALRALYIDFEGQKGRPPVLLGVHRRGRGARPFVAYDVLDEAFGVLAEPTLTLHAAITKLVQRAESRDRRIVAWSEHELDVVRTLADDDPALVARFEARFANARAIAERWRNAGGGAPGGVPGPDRLRAAKRGGRRPVGETIRILRDRLERGLPPTAVQQRRWDDLLEHNRHDCAGMRRVCLRATREMEATEAEPSAIGH